jgi:RimJ/RimL family protein N-acetyltransferase
VTTVPVFETDRLRLREWRESDIDALRTLLDDAETTRYLGMQRPYTLEDALAAFERRVRLWREDGMGLWAVDLKETGALVGWGGLQRIHYEEGLVGEVEVGWMIGRPWWGRGLAAEMGERAMRWGFDDLGLERIYAFCHPDNAKSERVMVKLGMEPAGQAKDMRDGSLSTLRVMTRERWHGLKEA